VVKCIAPLVKRGIQRTYLSSQSNQSGDTVERQTKTKFGKILKDHGLFFYNTADGFTAGIPDVYICGSNGRSIWVELKKLRKGPSLQHPLTIQQSVFLRKINASGGLGLMVVELPDGSWHVERITETGEVKKRDWKGIDIKELVKAW